MSVFSATKLLEESKKQELQSNASYLVWGFSGTAKSPFAATIAKHPQIERVYYWDSDTELNSTIHAGVLTEKELAKIVVIRGTDSETAPYHTQALLTWIKRAHQPLKLIGGRVAKAKETPEVTIKPFGSLTKNEAVIVDNWSRFSESLRHTILLKMDYAIDSGGEFPLHSFDVTDKDNQKIAIQTYAQQKQLFDGFFHNFVRGACISILVAHAWADDVMDYSKKPPRPSATFGEIFPLLGTNPYNREAASRWRNQIYCTIDESRGTFQKHTSVKTVKGVHGTRCEKMIDLTKIQNPTMLDLL